MTKTAARRAIEIGVRKERTITALGRALGVSRQAVSQWYEKGTVPPERVARLSVISGIPCHKIRPDVFPAPQVVAAE